MRSLTLKLTVAFVLIGVLSVIIFGVLVGFQTRTAFERFVVDRERAFVVDGVRALAEGRGSDQQDAAVDSLLGVGTLPSNLGRDAIIANADGMIVRGPPEYRPGTLLSATLR
ncbi:MAG: hypothetical protein ACRC1H_14420, partial [Caldilineaceae bacterium]